MGLAEKYAAYQTFKENLRGQKLQNDERQRLADLQRGMTTAAQSPNITTMQMQPEQPQLSLSALGRQMQPQQFQPAQAEVSPVVDAYRDGRMQTQTVKRSPELAAFEYLRQNDPQAAQAYAEKVMSAARSIALNGDHPGAVDYTNRSLGLNLKYAGTEGEFIKLANADGTVTLYNPKTEEERVIGTPKGPAEPYKPGELKEFQNDRTKIWREYVGKGQWRDRPELGQATIDKPVQPKIVVQGGGKGGGESKLGKSLPAGTLTDLNEASQMIKTLKEAQGLAAGVNTGPIMGRLQSFGQKFGVASGDFTQMKQKIATVNNAMLKLRSGAAVTESEYQRFLQEMPTANDAEEVRDAKFANATKYMEDLLEGKIATFSEGGYKVPTGVSGRSQPSGGKSPQPGKKGAKKDPLGIL